VSGERTLRSQIDELVEACRTTYDEVDSAIESGEKDKQLAALMAETDQQKRKALWDKFQQLVYDEVPIVKTGEFFGLSIKRKALKGENIPISSWPSFWNQWLEK